MDPFTIGLVTSAAGAGVNALGSILGANKAKAAAKEAARIRADAARDAGAFASGRLAELADGYESNMRNDLLEAYREIFDELERGEEDALAANEDYLARALAALNAGTGEATVVLDEAAAGFDPYSEAGRAALAEMRALLGLDGAEARQSAIGRFEVSPGYGLRFDEGVRAVDRSAAARGGLNSGATLKALQQRGQDLASQEYGNYFTRLSGLGDDGLTALTAQGNLAGNKAGLLSNAGMNSAELLQSAGNTAINAINAYSARNADALLGRGKGKLAIHEGKLNYLADAIPYRTRAITGSAEALASGVLGAGQARKQGITGVTNAIAGGLQGINRAAAAR